jgi:dCMP deaminase
MDRLNEKIYFANIAFCSGLRGTCPKAKVGAIIVKEKKIISVGYNGAPKGMKHCYEVGCIEDKNKHCIRSVHAEVNAIMKAGEKVADSELYCSHTPCIECCKVIINSGIKKVYYIFDYFDSRVKDLGYSTQLDFLLEGSVETEKINYSELVNAFQGALFEMKKLNLKEKIKNENY